MDMDVDEPALPAPSDKYESYRWLNDRRGSQLESAHAMRDAVNTDDVDIVRYVLTHSDYNLAKVGLETAITNGKLAIVRYFVERYGYPIEDVSYDLVYRALQNGHKETFRYMTEVIRSHAALGYIRAQMIASALTEPVPEIDWQHMAPSVQEHILAMIFATDPKEGQQIVAEHSELAKLIQTQSYRDKTLKYKVCVLNK